MVYFPKNQKSRKIVQLLEEAIHILVAVGIPIAGKSERSLEKMAMSFLAVAGVKNQWKEATTTHFLKTREVIEVIKER
jgi:type II restriction enzyme